MQNLRFSDLGVGSAQKFCQTGFRLLFVTNRVNERKKSTSAKTVDEGTCRSEWRIASVGQSVGLAASFEVKLRAPNVHFFLDKSEPSPSAFLLSASVCMYSCMEAARCAAGHISQKRNLSWRRGSAHHPASAGISTNCC